MTGKEFAITQDLLHAYADGALGEPERAAVEAYLAANPDKAAEVMSWQRQNEALAALFDPVAHEPMPARLNPRRIAAELARRRSGWTRLAAAAVVLIALGGSIGWYGRDWLVRQEGPAEVLIENAVSAHALFVREKRHAVEVAASEQLHLFTWLSNRIEREIDAPDLGAEGFALVGGRLLPAAYSQTGPAAQLMYENASAQRLTVYITAALPDRAAAYEFAEHNGLDAFYWANDRITCTVVGDLPEAEMRKVARKVYQQLTRRPDPGYRG